MDLPLVVLRAPIVVIAVVSLLDQTRIVLVRYLVVVSLCGTLAWYSISHDVPCHSSMFHYVCRDL